MNIVEYLNEGLKRVYHVTFPVEMVTKAYETRFAHFSKTAKAPGFRPGKVPLAMIKQRYSAQVRQDVIESFVEQGTKKAIEQSKGRTVDTPHIELTQEGENKDFIFSVHMELLPHIDLKPHNAFSLERLVYEVSAEDIQKELSSFAEATKEWEETPADHKAVIGDLVVADLKHLDAEKFLQLKEKEPYVFELGKGLSSNAGHTLPGLDEAIIGHKKGDQFECQIVFPKDYVHQEWSEKKAQVQITLHSIRTIIPSSVDDAFAQKKGFDSLVELKEAVRHHLQKSFDERTFLVVKRHLLDALAAQYKDVPVPPSLVEQEFKNIWTEFEAYLEKTGEELIEKEEAEVEYRSISERRIRLGLVLAELGQVLSVTVTTEELQQALLNVARNYPGQESQVIKFYQKNPQSLKSLQAPLFENKVVRMILSQNEVKLRNVTLKELEEAELALEDAPVSTDDSSSSKNPQTEKALSEQSSSASTKKKVK